MNAQALTPAHIHNSNCLPGPVVFKVWFLDQRCQHQLGAYWECRLWSPTPDALVRNGGREGWTQQPVPHWPSQ